MTALQMPAELVWDDDGDVAWASRETFTRGQARAAFCRETCAFFPDVSVRVVGMRLLTGDEARMYGHDEFYIECPKPEADFLAWRIT